VSLCVNRKNYQVLITVQCRQMINVVEEWYLQDESQLLNVTQ